MTPAFLVVANGPHAGLAWKALALPPGVTISGFQYEPEFSLFSADDRKALVRKRSRAVIGMAVLRNLQPDADLAPWVWGYPFRHGVIVDEDPISGITLKLGPTIPLGRLAHAATEVNAALAGALSVNSAEAIGKEEAADRSSVLTERWLHPQHPYLAGAVPLEAALPVPHERLWQPGTSSEDATAWRSAVRFLQTEILESQRTWDRFWLASDRPWLPAVAALRVAAVERTPRAWEVEAIDRTSVRPSWVDAGLSSVGGREAAVRLIRRRTHRIQILTRWGSAQQQPTDRVTYSVTGSGPFVQVESGRVDATPGGVARAITVRAADRLGPGELLFDFEQTSPTGQRRSEQLSVPVHSTGLPRPSIVLGVLLLGVGILAQMLGARSLTSNRPMIEALIASVPGDHMVSVGVVLAATGVVLLTYGLTKASGER